MLEKQSLIGSSMQKPNKQVASGNGGYDVPSVINSIDDFSYKSASVSKESEDMLQKKANMSVQVSNCLARVFLSMVHHLLMLLKSNQSRKRSPTCTIFS